jgi:hypothetical protein
MKNIILSNETIELAKTTALGNIICDDTITAKMYDKFINPTDDSLDITIWEPFFEYQNDWLIKQFKHEFNNNINFAKAVLKNATLKDNDVLICPDCGAKLKHAMLDVDGTNLEEVLECTNSECNYYTFDLSGGEV